MPRSPGSGPQIFLPADPPRSWAAAGWWPPVIRWPPRPPPESWAPAGTRRGGGEPFVQPELARTIETMIAAERRARGRAEGIKAARDAFYRGEIAEAICAFHRQEGGLVTRGGLGGVRGGG